ncbi:hypothetical protein D9758_006377 [Tetrapyrgos nigripes]|uniref:GH18 domain-containing protein n=1 Tax=Tetrapyrgos nigripes TaxID=182062 RepID=A0A8H5D8L3_9AGAR|nr:hypothetical protein D9758_006377 [Tetrapyrgos nigripes]
MRLPTVSSLLLFTPVCVYGSSIFTGWYTGYHVSDVPLSSVSWSKYTHMTYAFATPSTDDPSSPLVLTPGDETLLPQFVSAAHDHGVKALLSLGGWGGSRSFSTLVDGEEQRKNLVNATVELAKKYGLDGIDFDWEFPNRQGLGCNAVSPSSSDVPNFISYLQLLRQDSLGATLILSAAVPTTPYPYDFTFTEYFASTFLNPSNYSAFPDSSNSTKAYGSTPKPGASGYLSSLASVLDFIAIMNYDIWNPAVPYAFALTSTENNVTDSQVVPRAGSHAPLDDTCDQTPESWSPVDSPSSSSSNSQLAQKRRRGSAKTAVAAWIDAGFSADKIVLGIAAYGHGFHVAKKDAFASSPNGSGSGSSSSSSSPSSTFSASSSSPSFSASSSSASSTVFNFTSSFSSTSSDSSPSSSSVAPVKRADSSTPSRILAAYPPYTPSLTPIGDKWDAGAGDDACGNHVNAGGTWAFRGLIEGGYLTEDGSEVQADGEEVSLFPFVYNPNNETLISYDNAKSLAIKGAFIANSSLAGFAVWEVGGDSGDVLIDAIRSAIPDSPGGSGTTTQGGNAENSASSFVFGLSNWPVAVGITGVLGSVLVW